MDSIDNIRYILSPVFESHKVRKAILFGSYAKGSERENSDVDIYVDSGLRGLRFYGLLEDVVNSLGKPVDLIDASQVKTNSRISNEIEKTGVLIYERKG